MNLRDPLVLGEKGTPSAAAEGETNNHLRQVGGWVAQLALHAIQLPQDLVQLLADVVVGPHPVEDPVCLDQMAEPCP